MAFDWAMRQVFYAAHNYEVIPCHLIAPKDRDGRGKYAANSKRDKRRFQVAYADREEAEREVIEYANKIAAAE
jgi:hypothetical protein